MNAPSATPRLRAGTARAEITVNAPEHVHDPLFARVLLLDDGRIRFAVVALDAVAVGGICEIPDDFMPRLREYAATIDVAPGHLLVNASHTHTNLPMLRPPEELFNAVTAALSDAASRLEPVRCGCASGREERLMINRTLRLNDGSHWTIRQANPCPPDEMIAELGPTDPELGVIRIDRLDGSPLAVFFNFAGHPLIWHDGNHASAKYPGYAVEFLEETIGGGVTALFLQGAGGDQTEAAYKDVCRPLECESLGRMLGLSALRVYRGIVPETVEIAATSRHVRFPRRTDSDERIAELRAEERRLLDSLRFCSLNFKSFIRLYLAEKLDPEYPQEHAYRYLREQQLGGDEISGRDRQNHELVEKYLANIRAMEKLARIQDRIATFELHRDFNRAAAAPDIEAELVALRIGDCAIVSTPVEALCGVGLAIKAASPFPHTWLAAYSNGYMHYGALPEDYPGGGYEVTECFLAPGWYEVFSTAAREMLTELQKTGV